jgi:hypothetical protein
MRADYAFHFFRDGVTHPTLAATSNKGSAQPPTLGLSFSFPSSENSFGMWYV